MDNGQRYADYAAIFRVLGASVLFRETVTTCVDERVFDCFDACKARELGGGVLLEVASVLMAADATSTLASFW